MRTINAIALLFSLGSAALIGGEITDLYRQQEGTGAYRRPREAQTTVPVPQEKLQIDEIGIARGGGWSRSEVYEAIISSDGKVRWQGQRGVSRQGTHSGRIAPYQFRRLAEFAQEAGILNLPTKFYTGATDGNSTYLYTRHGQQKKVIWCYMVQPAALWALAELIDKALEGATWGREDLQAALRRKLQEGWVTTFECRDLPVKEVFELLREKSIETDPEGEGIIFTFAHPAGGFIVEPQRRINLAFGKVSLLDAIEIVSHACGLKFRIDDSSIAIIGDSTDHEAEQNKSIQTDAEPRR